MRFQRLKLVTGVIVCVVLVVALAVSVLRISLPGPAEAIAQQAKPKDAGKPAAATKDGKAVFDSYCGGCHFADKSDNKYGPGLKGLFALPKLPVSGRPVTEENILKQMKTPVKTMPPITQLNEAQTKSLMDYLKSL